MSDFSDLKPVKLSSIESRIKAEDEDATSAVEQKQPIAGCSQSEKGNTPRDASGTATAVATSDTADGSALIEDVLMQIFETDVLDKGDLLQFRLVNRCWRDSATSVLLQRSLCQISFIIDECFLFPSSFKYFSEIRKVYCNSSHNFPLEDLNELISKSLKFPCSNFHFINSFSFDKKRIDASSLLNFFSIHGTNVKTITVGGRQGHILKSELGSLLLNYAPNLECLDLQHLKAFRAFGDLIDPSIDHPLLPETVILPNLKTLVLGACPDFNLIELFDAAINLQSVENTTVKDLKLLLDHGKVGLIKKLEYGLYVYDLEELSVFEKLAESQPKLTHLTVFAKEHTIVGLRKALRESLKIQTFLNRILESSKDTLNYLEFRICPFGDIQFPVLKNLEYLKIVQFNYQNAGTLSTRPTFSLMELWYMNRNQHGRIPESLRNLNFECLHEVDARIYGRCSNRSCNSFPRLQNLQLDTQNYDVGTGNNLILLDTTKSHNKKIAPHAYKTTIKDLEIYSRLPETIERAKSVSNFFRDVTILKIKCKSTKELNCSLWEVSPLAKSIEIYGMSTDYHFYGEVSGEDDEVSFVDSLFTGFPIETCKKLNARKQIPTEMEEDPSLTAMTRLHPSICDLKDLTDFKIIFTELRATFASHVTGFFAFQSMPRTKITFAHAVSAKCNEDNEAECETKKYLEPISTFVHFAHKNLPERFEKVSYGPVRLTANR